VTAAARGRANRRRGADAERAVVRWLRDNGYEGARRYLAGDGHQPGDIDGVPWCIEVKDTASSAWPTWRAQALAQAGDKVPIVVRRTRGVRDVGLWEAEVPDGVLPTPWRGVCEVWYCPRTKQWWVRLPFGELVEALR
jgi:hypothetical protein